MVSPGSIIGERSFETMSPINEHQRQRRQPVATSTAPVVQAGTEMFENLARYQAEDGAWWTGYAFEDQVMWPDERPTWTAGAVLLAADALYRLTPAASLFTCVALPEPAHHAQGARAHQNLKKTRG